MPFMKTGQRAGLAALVTISLSGCAMNVADPSPNPAVAVPPPAAPMTCNAAKVQYHIGHDATQDMGTAILKDSGARTLRWGPPGGAWTMDYREDRVNVRYDGAMKITEVSCG